MNKLDEILYDSLKVEELPDQNLNRQIFEKWSKEEKTMKQKRKLHFQSYAAKVAAVLVLVALTAGTVTVGAIYLHKWSKSLGEGLISSKEKQKQLEEGGYADFKEITKTVNGVTISLEQSLADDNLGYIAFKVKGLENKEGMIPQFSNTVVQVEGTEPDWSGKFYNNIVVNKGGSISYSDGSKVEYDANDTAKGRYMDKDGNLEYTVMIRMNDSLEEKFVPSKNKLIGKKIHMELSDLSYGNEKGEIQTVKKGTWVFDWTLKGKAESVEKQADQKVGSSAVTITNVKMTPLSVSITGKLDMNRYKEAKDGMWDKDNATLPAFYGVKYRNGTIVYIGTMDSWQRGFDEDGLYHEFTGISSDIIDVGEVVSLIYIDGPLQETTRKGYVAPTKDQFVEVKLK